MKERARQKDDELCRSDISDIKGYPEVKMPNPNHLHCGVCKIPFEDYIAHIESAQHKSSIGVHKN